MTPGYQIFPLTARRETVDALARLLIETVAHRGSIGFMHHLTGTIVYWKRI